MSINHGDNAVALLSSAFRKPGVERMVRALVTPVQVVDDFAASVVSGLRVDTATNPQLRALGKLVGELQGELTDAEFRRVIRAKARALRTTGAARDSLDVAHLLLGEGTGGRVILSEIAPCYYEVTVLADPGAPWTAAYRARARRILDLTRPAGWGAGYLYAAVTPPFAVGPVAAGAAGAGFDVGAFSDYL